MQFLLYLPAILLAINAQLTTNEDLNTTNSRSMNPMEKPNPPKHKPIIRDEGDNEEGWEEDWEEENWEGEGEEWEEENEWEEIEEHRPTQTHTNWSKPSGTQWPLHRPRPTHHYRPRPPHYPPPNYPYPNQHKPHSHEQHKPYFPNQQKPHHNGHPYPPVPPYTIYPSSKYICHFDQIESEEGVLRIGKSYKQASGFAISSDKICRDKYYCHYACEEGYYNTQYKVIKIDNTINNDIINSGLYCNRGRLQRQFNLPLCSKAQQNIYIKSNSDNQLCKATYPGNLSPIIPVKLRKYDIRGLSTIPFNMNYNAYSLYYINLNQYNQCERGSSNQPIGTSAPYLIKITQLIDNKVEFILKWNAKFIINNFKQTYFNDLISVKVGCLNPQQCNNLYCILNKDSKDDYLCKLLLPNNFRLLITLNNNQNILEKNNTII